MCFISHRDPFYWPGLFPSQSWGEGWSGLCKPLLPKPLWGLGFRQGVSCHHATLTEVQAMFPSCAPGARWG